MIRMGSILTSALVLTTAIPTLARERVRGPCQFRDGICYQSIGYVLSTNEAERLLRSSPQKPPLRITSKDLRTGHENLLMPNPSPTVRQPQLEQQNQAQPSLREFSRKDRPWSDSFYRTAVKIEASFPDQPANTISVCSGTIIGSHTVFTAGHCIYSHEDGGWASWVHVYPAMASYHITPYGKAVAVSLNSTNWWTEHNDFDGDTAIIQLQQDQGELTGWPAIDWNFTTQPAVLNVAGYPAAEGYNGDWIYQESGHVTHMSDYVLCGDFYLVGGMSGGPAWLDHPNDDSRFLVATNSYCTSDYCCVVRYTDLNEIQRTTSEESESYVVSNHWTCDIDWFWDRAGCDCNCGIWDPDCNDPEQSIYHCQGNEACVDPGVCECTPSCSYRQCGSDGCAGSCGSCLTTQECQDGFCVCQPQCGTRECGPDPICGESCGACPDGFICNAGTCVCDQNCRGVKCGPDPVCGLSCGGCPAGSSCRAGSCYCEADCNNRQCGTDGCSGVCGTCEAGQTCQAGKCVSGQSANSVLSCDVSGAPNNLSWTIFILLGLSLLRLLCQRCLRRRFVWKP